MWDCFVHLLHAADRARTFLEMFLRALEGRQFVTERGYSIFVLIIYKVLFTDILLPFKTLYEILKCISEKTRQLFIDKQSMHILRPVAAVFSCMYVYIQHFSL